MRFELILTKWEILSYSHYTKRFKGYINNIFINENSKNHLYLLCKVKFSKQYTQAESIPLGGYRTLGHLVKVNYQDKDLFIDFLTERLGYLTESYTIIPITEIIFSYTIMDGVCEDENRTLLSKESELISNEGTTHNFNNMNLPITLLPHKYGDIRSMVDANNLEFIRFIVASGNNIFEIDIYNYESNNQINKVTILGNIKLDWIDTRLEMQQFEA